MSCNSCNFGNFDNRFRNAVPALIFPDFVRNSCCNPCCTNFFGNRFGCSNFFNSRCGCDCDFFARDRSIFGCPIRGRNRDCDCD